MGKIKVNKITSEYLRNKKSGYLSKNQNFEHLDKYLRLDLGENLLGNVKITNVLKTIQDHELRYYADPSNTKIKATVASLYNLLPKNVLIANNSNEIIDFLPKIIIDKGDKSLLLVPTFFRFHDSLLQSGSKLIYLKLKEQDRFQFNENILEKILNLSKTKSIKTIWICNPNNPTGEVIRLEDIEAIVKNSKAFVIVDEAFFELYDPENKNSSINLVNKYKNLIVLRTLSKAYGLAGIRFGYALAHPKTVELIEDYRDTLMMTSQINIKIAMSALNDRNFIKQTAEKTKQLRNNIFESIKELSNLKLAADSKTNIFLLKHLKKDLHKELLKRGILVADFRDSKGIENLGYVRITIGKEQDNKKLINELREIN